MEIKLKQRLVGAMVLIALAIIFLPSLFHKDERVVVDSTSLIPPKPTVEPIIIKAPEKVANVKAAPAPDKAFQPPVTPQVEVSQPPQESVVGLADNLADNKEPVKPLVKKPSVKKPVVQKTAPKSTSKSTPKPTLNKQGIPNAWVVQVASLKSKKSAAELSQQLQKSQYKAYSRSIKTPKGTFYRVFVGPYIDKSRALLAKSKVDKSHRVDSRVLKFTPE